MRPGFNTALRESPPARPSQTELGTWFAVGPTEFGPLEPTLYTSPDDFRRGHGGHVSTSHLPNAADTFFAEGGSRMYVGRVVGPDADVASVEFDDNAAAATLRVSAAAPGAWYNGLRASIVIDGAEFSIEVDHEDDPGRLLVDSPNFATKVDAVAWAESNKYIRVASLAPNTLPVADAAVPLAGGDDDIAGITQAEQDAVLPLFNRQLGPGFVSMPGNTSQGARDAIGAHCLATNRRGLVDFPDTDQEATLTTAADASRTNGRVVAGFAPWDVIPGLFPRTTRVVPPCARAAGTIARVLARGNPNKAAAGDDGLARYVIDLTQTFTDDEYTALNDAGVNMSREIFGSDVQIYGFRTLADPVEDERWVELSGSILMMHVTAQSNMVMAPFAFDQIDGRGHKYAELEGALGGDLARLYEMDAIYGETPQDAYRVEVASVNTPETARNRELHAVIGVVPSPFAEMITTEIVRSMVGEEV